VGTRVETTVTFQGEVHYYDLNVAPMRTMPERFTQRNVEEAARTAGIGARTLLRWMKLPEFQTAP
jgi:hypothetical protein